MDTKGMSAKECVGLLDDILYPRGSMEDTHLSSRHRETLESIAKCLQGVDKALDRGKKFEDIYRKVKGTVYSNKVRWLEIELTKLEAEFFGSSPTTVVVETEKIYKIINEVERGAHGYTVDPEKIVGMLENLFPNNKEDC